MDQQTKKIVEFSLLAVIGFLLFQKAVVAVQTFTQILGVFLPSVESFSATPYWDHKQWSWGYGTRVPGSVDDPNQRPGGTISRVQAFNDMFKHFNGDYQELKPQITRNLNAKQWAALLSFSYNEGVGNAENLLDDINAGDDDVLEVHWKKYIYASHVVNSDLVQRRNKEWSLWIS